jgi:hypothetical protein
VAGQLTQPVSFGTYQISLPREFTFLPPKGQTPADLKMFAWQGPAAPGEPPPLLFVGILSDKKILEDAKKNMRQVLVNYSAGLTDSIGAHIAGRGATETGSLDGIGWTRFQWSGATTSQVPAAGFAYGAIDDASVIAIIPINFGADAGARSMLMESIIATFKKTK